jgi:hypothetical protein
MINSGLNPMSKQKAMSHPGVYAQTPHLAEGQVEEAEQCDRPARRNMCTVQQDCLTLAACHTRCPH